MAPPKKVKQAKPAPDAIGVFSDDKPESAPDPDPQTYFCQNCQGTVHQGDERCPVCNERLNWAAVGR